MVSGFIEMVCTKHVLVGVVHKLKVVSSYSFLWQAPLGLCSAKHRHQSPEWTILSHVNCFIQGEVIGFQVLLDSLHPRSTRASWWSPPVLQGEAVKIFLASVSSGIHTLCPKQGEMPCLDNIRKVWLPVCLSHLSTCDGIKVVGRVHNLFSRTCETVDVYSMLI